MLLVWHQQMWRLHCADQHGGERKIFACCVLRLPRTPVIQTRPPSPFASVVRLLQLTGKCLAHVINVAVENSKDKVVCIHSQFLEQLLHEDVQANIIVGTTIFVWGPARDGERLFHLACF
jgi:hypothetical protein